jgi:hypothetical protein
MTAQSNRTGVVQPVVRQGDNTLDTGTIPIVFVPGVMGSRLHFTTLGVYWDPDRLIRRMPRWLTSSADRVRRDFSLSNPATVMTEGSGYTAQQLARGWAGVAADFYKGLLQHLTRQRYGAYRTPVYAIGYDWRQSNEISGAAVMERIAEIVDTESAQRFILLSHSMGGLVTRAGLQNDTSGVADKLLGVCHIAQPATGAAVAARRMFTGATFGGDGVAMMALLGNNRQKFQTIISSLPGPMQLLPTQDFTDTDGGWWYTYRTFERPDVQQEWRGLCWDLYAQPQSPPGLLAPADSRHSIAAVPRREFSRRLGEARAFHMALGLYKHPKTWSFYGDGNRCDTNLHFRLPPLHAELAVWSSVLHSLNPFSEDIRYKARRADGTEVTIPGSQVDPADRGCVIEQNNRSDGTVPVASGKALFRNQAHRFRAGTDYDYDSRKQFYAQGGNKHDKICVDRNCLGFLDDLITHLVGSV